LWAPDPVEFAGEFYSLPTASMLPKPVQQSGPPVLLGGTAPRALARAGRLSDGWISSSRADLDAIGESVEAVRAGAREAGRDPAGLRFVCRGVLLDEPRTRPLTGSFEQVRGDFATLADQGVTEVFLDLNFDPSVGNPDVPAETAMRRAHAVLEALAPGA
jgi:hypothetical protein